MFGYSAAELRELNISSLYQDPDLVNEILRSLAVGESWAGELYMVSKKNHRFPVYLHANAITNSSGEILGLIGVHKDITNIKQAEQNLLEAKEKAEISTQAKSQFLANMSHELRTPMNAIIGMNDLLLGTPLDDKQGQYAKTIKLSADILLGIINDILDFSGIKDGTHKLQKINFEFSVLINKITQNTKSEAAKKELKFSCSIDPEIPETYVGDPDRLYQILTSLLDNAIKFTRQGSISLLCKPDNEEKTRLRFWIHDTGIGIPKEKKEDLFDSFSQVDPSATRSYGGTGLGLAISKQLVEMMGGHIGVDSTRGKGSTFWFTINLELYQQSQSSQNPVQNTG